MSVPTTNIDCPKRRKKSIAAKIVAVACMPSNSFSTNQAFL